MKRITAVARGIVQGVGYRYFITGCARDTGVRGCVRNKADGSVEVIAEGDEAQLNRFITLIWAAGDDLIHVSDLQVRWEESTGEFSGFSMRW
jgi:acylphosphatase